MLVVRVPAFLVATCISGSLGAQLSEMRKANNAWSDLALSRSA